MGAIADTALAVEVGTVAAGFVAAVVAGGSTVALPESMLVDWPGSRQFAVEKFEIACSRPLLP